MTFSLDAKNILNKFASKHSGRDSANSYGNGITLKNMKRNNPFNRYLLVIILGMFWYTAGKAQDSTNYYYQGYDYGSQRVFNPLTTVINGGFGIMQIRNRSNKLSAIDFENGFDNVTSNLLNPFDTIDQYGWGDFFSHEVFPTTLTLESAQFYPNIYNHLIGGGFTYRAFVDWYQHHQFAKPKLWAFGSWFSYHFLNEIVENNQFSGANVDPIADMYIFNTAGLILFSFDRVNRFFSRTLNMQDWSFMPAYDPWQNTIENNGQNYMVRIKLPYLDRWSLLYHWGIHGMYGLSYHRQRGDAITAAGGLVVRDLVDTNNDSGVRELTATLIWTGGIFWDRNGSLLSSLIMSGKGYRARLNIYPGVLRIGKISPGIFVKLREDNSIVTGLHYSFVPFGIGRRIQ